MTYYGQGLLPGHSRSTQKCPVVAARLNVVMPNDIRSQMSSLLDLNYTTTEAIAAVARMS